MCSNHNDNFLPHSILKKKEKKENSLKSVSLFTEHRKKLELNHSICIQRIVIIVCIFNCIEYTYTGVLGSSKLNNIYTFKRYASSMLNYLIIYIKLEVLKSFLSHSSI